MTSAKKASAEWQIRLALATAYEHGRHAEACGDAPRSLDYQWEARLCDTALSDALKHISESDAWNAFAAGFAFADDWDTGGHLQRGYMSTFMHIVRSPLDPERLSRKKRQEMHENSVTKWCGDLKAGTKPQWKAKILEVLAGGELLTFNAIVLRASGMEYTADVAHGKAPDSALWELVGERKIEHTMATPILFRIIKGA